VSAQFEDTNFMWLIVKLKDVKSDRSYMMASDNRCPSPVVESRLVLVPGLLTAAFEELSKTVPHSED
jgi:hypothetical protein